MGGRMKSILVLSSDKKTLIDVKDILVANIGGLQEIYPVSCLNQALRYYHDYQISLAIVDLSLDCSNQSGDDLLGFSRWIASVTPRTQQIILCFPEDLVYVHQGLTGCEYSFLQKPVQPHILIGVVNKVFRKIATLSLRYRQDPPPDTAASAPLPGIYTDVILPDMNNWKHLLRANAYERVSSEIHQFLKRVPGKYRKDRIYIGKLQEDFKQLIYSIMLERNISAHELFSNQKLQDLLVDIRESVEDLDCWCQDIITFITQALEDIELENTPFGRAVDYIEKHIMEMIQRDAVAGFAGVHPDYLSQIFRKRFGFGVTQYIFTRKMEMAANLLKETKLPVGEIASGLGYTNLSHFSCKFKKHYAVTPVRYRNAHFLEYHSALHRRLFSERQHF
jgi:AraC-like DNA-binding protein